MMKATLEALPAIGLADLEQRAALQTRFDRKYIMATGEAEQLLDALAPAAVVLDIKGNRQFSYSSRYFDTPDLSSYHRTAHRHRRRFKVRTRTYLNSGTCWLEVKVPGPRDSTIKYRVPHEPCQQHTVDDGRDFLNDIFARHGLPVASGTLLAATLCTEYQRFTLLLPESDSRVTFDTALRWAAGEHELRLPLTAIVETKTRSASSRADRELWRRGQRPVALSKYATGLAALRSDLPAARWHRVLSQHFTVAQKGTVLD